MKINFRKITLKLTDLALRYFRYIAIVFVIIIIVIGYLSLIKPKWNEINQTGIFDYNFEKNRKQNNEIYLEGLKVSLDKFQKINKKDIEKLSKVLPSEEGIPDLFIIIEELMDKSGLKLDSIDITKGKRVTEEEQKKESSPAIILPESLAQEIIKEAPTTANIYTLDISIATSGGRGYDHLKEFLDNIEKELRIMDVKSLSFDPQGQTVETQGTTFSIALKTYYYQEE